MPDHKLTVVIGMAPGYWKVMGDDNRRKIEVSHPNVHVEIADDREQFGELALQADAVMSVDFPIPAQALQPDSRLRWVHSVRAGIDGVSTPELMAAEHVAFTASKGPHAPIVAEQIVALILSLARHISSSVLGQAEHRWLRGDQGALPHVNTQLLGKTIAILGVGQVGQHLARICQVGFQMKVLGMSRTSRDSQYVDRYFECSELHEALAEADVVALCLALTQSTEKIIGKSELEAMKPTAFLINGARGGLIDEAALIDAMNARVIGGAGLDTVSVEPLPADSPLWDLPNTLITSHMASMADGTGNEISKFLIENICRFAENQPLLGTVHRDGGY